MHMYQKEEEEGTEEALLTSLDFWGIFIREGEEGFQKSNGTFLDWQFRCTRNVAVDCTGCISWSNFMGNGRI